jgi:hypothetical protein
MPKEEFDFYGYDDWKTTDPVWEGGANDRAKCAYEYVGRADKLVNADDLPPPNGTTALDKALLKAIGLEPLIYIIKWCNIPYEDHDDESLGHEFVMPEPEERDY